MDVWDTLQAVALADGSFQAQSVETLCSSYTIVPCGTASLQCPWSQLECWAAFPEVCMPSSGGGMSSGKCGAMY